MERTVGDMIDDEFLIAFEDCTLPFGCWDHRAHVRVAFCYASRHELQEATNHMRSGIKACNKANDVPEAIDRGYHETVTQAFMRLIRAANRLTGPHRCSDEFCEAHPELLDRFVLRQFYSRERIMTMEANAWLVPAYRLPIEILHATPFDLTQP